MLGDRRSEPSVERLDERSNASEVGEATPGFFACRLRLQMRLQRRDGGLEHANAPLLGGTRTVGGRIDEAHPASAMSRVYPST